MRGRNKQGGTKHSTLEAMLKHSRKTGLQRANAPLPKHGNETLKQTISGGCLECSMIGAVACSEHGRTPNSN